MFFRKVYRKRPVTIAMKEVFFLFLSYIAKAVILVANVLRF